MMLLPKFKIPTIIGNIIEVLGSLAAFYLLLIAAYQYSMGLSLLLYLIALGCLVFFPHCLAHFVVGRLVGIRFRYYLLGKSSVSRLNLPLLSTLASRVPVLTLKIDRASLNSASRGKRAVVFISGAAASIILPFIVPMVSIGHAPILVSGILFLTALANAAFDLYYSPRAGDISRQKPLELNP